MCLHVKVGSLMFLLANVKLKVLLGNEGILCTDLLEFDLEPVM